VVRWEGGRRSITSTAEPAKATFKPGGTKSTTQLTRSVGSAGDAETGKHAALVCTHGEVVGRWWGRWEDMDERGRWMKKVKNLGGVCRKFGRNVLRQSRHALANFLCGFVVPGKVAEECWPGTLPKGVAV